MRGSGQVSRWAEAAGPARGRAAARSVGRLQTPSGQIAPEFLFFGELAEHEGSVLRLHAGATEQHPTFSAGWRRATCACISLACQGGGALRGGMPDCRQPASSGRCRRRPAKPSTPRRARGQAPQRASRASRFRQFSFGCWRRNCGGSWRRAAGRPGRTAEHDSHVWRGPSPSIGQTYQSLGSVARRRGSGEPGVLVGVCDTPRPG